MQRAKYEIRCKLSQNKDGEGVLLYYVFNTISLTRMTGWLRSERDARTVLLQFEERERRREEMESKRKHIVENIEKLADDAFDLVCEELCKFPEKYESQEALWEERCKDCPLKRFL